MLASFGEIVKSGETKSSPQRWLSPPATLSDDSLDGALWRAYCRRGLSVPCPKKGLGNMFIFYQFNSFPATPLSFGLKVSFLIKSSIEDNLVGAIKLPDITMKAKKKITPVKQIEKAYEPKVIPDRTDELIKKAEEANIRLHEQALAERRHREELKQKKILAAKEDKFSHAINLIIERTEYQKAKKDSFSIDYHDFNFEDTMDESRVLEGFLEKLKRVGAIKNYSRQNYTGGVRFYFTRANIEKLKQHRKQVSLFQPGEGRRKFPPDTRWEDITIQFLNGDEVLIRYEDIRYQTNYEEMGFQDKRTKSPNKPNRQWEFLKGLSETDGEISWRSPKATPQGKKQKQLLSKRLKEYFRIDGDPFYSYKKEKTYKIKLTLIPEQKSSEDNKDSELEEFYKKQTPEVYDKYG